MGDYRVIIKNGEVFIRRWVPEMREYEIVKKKNQILSDVLQFSVDIEETTFGQFFDLIAREADFFERVFCGAMYRHPLRPYIDEIQKPPSEDSSDIWKTRVFWGAELFEGELSIGPDFGGYGKWDQQGQADWPSEGGVALEYTGLNEYKHLPFVLEKDTDIREIKPKAEPLVKATMDFTVYDVIRAILYEITWSGDISKGRKGPDLPSPSEIEDMKKRSDDFHGKPGTEEKP